MVVWACLCIGGASENFLLKTRYINSLFDWLIDWRQQLRSSLSIAAVVKRTRTHFGKRAFSVCGPHTWNSLPAVRNIDSYPAFRRALKSYLFHRAFTDWLLFYFLYLRTLRRIDYCNAQSVLFIWLGTRTLLLSLSLSLSIDYFYATTAITNQTITRSTQRTLPFITLPLPYLLVWNN